MLRFSIPTPIPSRSPTGSVPAPSEAKARWLGRFVRCAAVVIFGSLAPVSYAAADTIILN